MAADSPAKYQLAPKSEWGEMTIQQLYELRTNMQTLYFDMLYSGASFAKQYQDQVKHISALIMQKESSTE